MLAEAAAAIVGYFSNHAVPTGVIPLEPSATLFNGAHASGESPEVGRGNPVKDARSQLCWGRVACAHVQPATVKAHAPDL
jgi:hypothetical protein